MDKIRQQLDHWHAQVVSDQTNGTAWFNLGWWSARAGLFRQAVDAYKRSIGCGISEPEEAMSNLASVYSDQLADPEAAMEWLNSYALLESDSGQAALEDLAALSELDINPSLPSLSASRQLSALW